MKKIIYGICIISLPFIYVGSTYITDQPVEWSALGLMALILSPVFFWKVIGKIERDFNALPDQEKIKVITKSAIKVAKTVRNTNGL